jgi:hypothetical protein
MQEEGVHGPNRLETRAKVPLVVVATEERGAERSMRGTGRIPSEIGSEVSHRCGVAPAVPMVAHRSGKCQPLLARWEHNVVYGRDSQPRHGAYTAVSAFGQPEGAG